MGITESRNAVLQAYEFLVDYGIAAGHTLEDFPVKELPEVAETLVRLSKDIEAFATEYNDMATSHCGMAGDDTSDWLDDEMEGDLAQAAKVLEDEAAAMLGHISRCRLDLDSCAEDIRSTVGFYMKTLDAVAALSANMRGQEAILEQLC